MKKDELKVISVNKPSKEQSDQKAKELCELLQKTWPSPKNGEGQMP